YLLDKYPAGTAKDADEAAARQMAIWVFSDGVDPTTIQDAKIRDRAIALVNEAKSGACPNRRTEAPDLALDSPNASPAAGQTVAYTGRAGAADAGRTVKVSVSGPAVLSDASGANSGQQQQDVTLDAQGQANFWVTGTGPGQTTVRVELPYRLEVGTVFSQLDPGAPTQRLVMAESRDLKASVTGQLTWSGTAPQPSPTGPAQAPQPSPTAAAPTQQASAPEATQVPPTPTHKPSHHNATPTEQATIVVSSGEQATAAPTAAAPNTTAAPVVAPETAGQATPVGQSPTAALAAAGAAQPRPRSPPNTGSPNAAAGWLIIASAALLALGGWLIRRRAR